MTILPTIFSAVVVLLCPFHECWMLDAYAVAASLLGSYSGGSAAMAVAIAGVCAAAAVVFRP